MSFFNTGNEKRVAWKDATAQERKEYLEKIREEKNLDSVEGGCLLIILFFVFFVFFPGFLITVTM